MVGDVVFRGFNVDDHHVGGPVFLHLTDQFSNTTPVWKVNFQVSVHVQRRIFWVVIKLCAIEETRLGDKVDGEQEKYQNGWDWELRDGTGGSGFLPFTLEAFWSIKHCIQGTFRVHGFHLVGQLIANLTTFSRNGCNALIADGLGLRFHRGG